MPSETVSPNDLSLRRRAFLSLTGALAGLTAASDIAVGAPVETHTIPGRIQVEDFFDYYDTTAANAGGAYRETGVDIEAGTDDDGTPTVGWTWTTELLTYKVDVTPGTYDINVRAASWRDEGGIKLIVGPSVIGHIQFEPSDDIYDWKTTTLRNVEVTASGETAMYIQFLGGSTNLNWIEFVDPDTSASVGYGMGSYGMGSYGQ